VHWEAPRLKGRRCQADPFGHIWAISTVKEELTPEQVHERMIAAFKEK
jgi:hypothetical protein